MAGQLCPSPAVYLAGFVIGVVLCVILFVISCWRSLEFHKACLRLNRHRRSEESSKSRDDCSSHEDDEDQAYSVEEDDEEEDREDMPWWKMVFECCIVAFCILYFSGDYTHMVVLLVWVVVSLVAMFILVYFKPPANEVLRQLRFGIYFEALLMLTAITFATFATVMTVHAHAMTTEMAQYDYFGPMRVTGVDATLDRIYVGDDKWVDEMRGQVQLEFGGSWACPNSSQDSACVAVTYDDYTCNKIVCSSQWQQCADDDGDANAFTLECQENRHADALALVEAGTAYDPSIPPKQDENSWPYVNAFGKCSTCEANRYPDKFNVALESWNMAQALLLCGVGLLVVTGITLWRRRTINSKDSHVELIRNDQARTV